MRRVVLVAAEAREFAGVLRRAPVVRPLPWPLRFAVELTRPDAHWVLVAHGPGPQLAGVAARVSLEREGADALVSTGYCGGLSSRFGLQAVVVAQEVRAEESGTRHAARPPLHAPAAPVGIVVSLDRVAQTAGEREALRRGGADLVEMEALAVAAHAAARGVPFHCVRVVTDVAGETFHLDLNAARDREGRFSAVRIVAQAARHPLTVLPELLELHRRSRRASDTLGEFLVDCAF